MNRKIYWGIAILIMIISTAAVFLIRHELAEHRELNHQLEDVEKLANQIKQRKIAEVNSSIEVKRNHDQPDRVTDKPFKKVTYTDGNGIARERIEFEGQIYRYFKPGEKHLFNYRYEDGIYKGMTYHEAYKAWETRVRKARDRWMASIDISSELTQAKIDSANAKLLTILSIFKTLSPEELELAKSETIKEYPEQADELESFFNDIANHSTTKSLEEIANDYEFILESDKAIWTATYKIRAEVDKNYAELEQAKKEKPQRPTF